MAQNPSETSDLLDQDNSANDLKETLKNLQDPLDPQLLENLSLFFKVKGVNPVPLIKLYEECITSLGKNWEPFIGALGSTLNKGVVACEYLMLKYSECLKVIEHGDFPTMLSYISSCNDRQQQPNEDSAMQIKDEKESAAVSNVSALSTSSDLASVLLTQFIWEDGKTYKSKIGYVTANRDGTIAIDLSSLEYQNINSLRTMKMNPKNWDFILNRDLDRLISYLSMNLKKFEDFNKQAVVQKADILKDLGSHVPINNNQWKNAPVISECILPIKLELDLYFKIDGWLHYDNIQELLATVVLIILTESEIQLKLSKAAIHFLQIVFLHMGLQKTSKNDLNLSQSVEKKLGTFQTTGIYMSKFSYKLQYSTFEISERKSLKENWFSIKKAPSADDKAELENLLVNVKTVNEQNRFMKYFLYLKEDEPLIPIPTD